mmetsp:Transcript_35790/g.58835  ORF Transcript_35790/g.58835 Transcript_35790/m.58835 type:complete len:209 (+) Transcript_35790:468-1094(+)
MGGGHAHAAKETRCPGGDHHGGLHGVRLPLSDHPDRGGRRRESWGRGHAGPAVQPALRRLRPVLHLLHLLRVRSHHEHAAVQARDGQARDVPAAGQGAGGLRHHLRGAHPAHAALQGRRAVLPLADGVGRDGLLGHPQLRRHGGHLPDLAAQPPRAAHGVRQPAPHGRVRDGRRRGRGSGGMGGRRRRRRRRRGKCCKSGDGGGQSGE